MMAKGKQKEAKDDSVTGAVARRMYFGKKLPRAAGPVLAVVAGVAIATVLVLTHLGSKGVCTDEQNRYLLLQASTSIPLEGKQSLAPLAAKIKQLNGYQKDPNCMTVLFYNAIDRGQWNQAESYLRTVKQEARPSQKLSPYLGQDITPQTLQDWMDHINEDLINLKQNSIPIKQPF